MNFFLIPIIIFFLKIAFSQFLFENELNEEQCKQKYYGTNCTKECDINCNYTEMENCDKETGYCKCNIGYYSKINDNICYNCPSNCLDCESELKCLNCKEETQYDNLCDKECLNCIEEDNKYCDRDGKCYGECVDGFYGDKCDKKCESNCEKCNKENGKKCLKCINDDFYLKNSTCYSCWEGCDKCTEKKCKNCKYPYNYGDFCNKTCSNNCLSEGNIRVCDRETGYCNKCKNHFRGNFCEICPPNFQGDNCNECSPHFTGDNCDSCVPHFRGEKCDECEHHFTGDNCNQCLPRFQGKNCDECAPHFTGEDCSSCQPHFEGVNCSVCEYHYQGENCTKCSDNFTGIECETCIQGKFGIYCNGTCPENCNLSDGNCKDDGTCFSCVNGYYGKKCEKKCIDNCLKCDYNTGACIECKNGHYGQNCENTCAEHCLNNQCNKNDGTCNCEDNFTPPNLCNECTDGHYGNSCNFECGNSCIKCNMENGSCESCNKGFFYINGSLNCEKCSDECLDGNCEENGGKCFNCTSNEKYGDYCNETCPIHCISKGNRKCDDKLGTCDSCEGNYIGEKCDNCKNEYYDINTCDKKCSMNCSKSQSSRLCDIESGKCNECIDNQYGDFCEKECKSCKDKCNQTTGICQECAEMYYKNGTECLECPLSCIYCNDDGCESCIWNKYGTWCDKNCNEGCEDSCNHLDGKCNSCKKNLYDDNCDKECNGCEKGCYQENGECINHLCKSNFYYSFSCNKACSIKCKKGCDLYNGECNKCEKGKWGIDCEKECDEECEDNDCCFVKSGIEVPKLKIDVHEKNENFNYISMKVGNNNPTLEILIDDNSRAPLVLFDNKVKINYLDESDSKIFKISNNTYSDSGSQVKSDFKINIVKFSFMECEGSFFNDTIDFGDGQKGYIHFLIPNKINYIEDSIEFPNEIQGFVGLGFLSMFSESLILNNIISKNIVAKVNNSFIFGDFPQEVKKDFSKTTVLTPNITLYKLNEKSEFYSQLSGFAITYRKAYNYSLEKPITLKLSGETEITLSNNLFLFFEKVYFRNALNNKQCKTNIYLKTFICDSIETLTKLPKFGIIIDKYIYYLEPLFLFTKYNANEYKFIINFSQSSQKIILGKSFFQQYTVIFNNGKQVLNFYGNTKKLNFDYIDLLKAIVNENEYWFTPGLITIIITYSIVGLISFFYIVKYCWSEESDYEYEDDDDDEEFDYIFENE